jgi:putative inorganic carbon (HCO3(-)) transporter
LTARAVLAPRVLPAALFGTALLLGVLAGVEPRLALIVAFGIAFVGITIVSLTAGLCLFAVLSFMDTVIPYDTGGALSFPKLMGILLVLSWLAMLSTRRVEARGVFSHAWFIYVLVLFLGWAAISITWAEQSAPAIDAVLRYAPNAMLFLIVFSAVRTRQQAIWVVAAFVLGALASAVYGLFVPTDPAAADRLSGAEGNANETAAALVAGAALAGALAAALKGQTMLRLAAAVGVPLCGYAIFLTLSRGGLVALAAALVASVFVAGRWRPAVLAIAVAAAVSAVVYFAAFAPASARQRVTELEGGTGRVDIWKVGWRMVEANPLHGIGAGNFQNTSVHFLLQPGAIVRDDFIVDTPKAAHNTYLEVLAELGIVGLVLFLVIVGFAIGTTFRSIGIFARVGDTQMEMISRALFVALVGLLAANFFGSREFNKQLWMLMALGPAFLSMARTQLAAAASGGGGGRLAFSPSRAAGGVPAAAVRPLPVRTG